MRACGVYGAALVVVSGERFNKYMGHATDTMKAWRHVPVLHISDVMASVPYDCVPVAVDLLDGAIPLPEFKHPERAYYVFGPEDGTLGARVVDHCAYAVYVPTQRCMNLAATVNVVLYDRLAKLGALDAREAVARAICAAEPRGPDPDAPIYVGMQPARAWQGRLDMADAAIIAGQKTI